MKKQRRSRLRYLIPRWLVKPVSRFFWMMGRFLVLSSRYIATHFPQQGWLCAVIVLIITSCVLSLPSVINTRIPEREGRALPLPSAQSLGTIRPLITLNLNPFSEWTLLPRSPESPQIVLTHHDAEFSVIRGDEVENPIDYFQWYVSTKLGIHSPGRIYLHRTSIKDTLGNSVVVDSLERVYHTSPSRSRANDRSLQIVMYSYSTMVLLLVVSTQAGMSETYADLLRAVKASLRITP